MTKGLTKTQNADIMNAIRADMNEVYRADVPMATSATYQAVGQGIMDGVHANTFLSALLDKIGLTIAKSATAQNHLARFHKGVLPFGYTVEEIFVEIASSMTFDPAVAETELYKREQPDVKAKYHAVNRQSFYKTTVQEAQLRQAFTNEQGLSTLIMRIIESLVKGDNYDQYQLTKKALVDHAKTVGVATVEVADPLASADNMKAFVKKAREISTDMVFLSDKYTTAGVKNDCPKERQVILITAELDASLDVDVLASAFNMSRVEFLAQRHVVDSFDYTTTDGQTGTLDGVYAMIVDSDFLMVYDTNFRSETVWNGQGLYWNYILHHWQVIATSGYNNAVVFKKSGV